MQMPDQNLDVITRLYDAFNRRDMPGMLECMDPEMEVSAPEGLEYAAVMMRLLGPRGVVLLDKYRGHDEVRRLYEARGRSRPGSRSIPRTSRAWGSAVVVPAALSAATADAAPRARYRSRTCGRWREEGHEPADLR